MQFLKQATKSVTQVQVPKQAKPKLLKPIVRFYPTLNIKIELIKLKLLF